MREIAGIRATVYTLAARCQGCYNIDKNNTIYYENSNLKISIVFEQKEKAHQFINELMTFCNLKIAKDKIIFDQSNDVIELKCSSSPCWILYSDYNTNDFDSPNYTLNSANCLSNKSVDSENETIFSLSDPESNLLMIENPRNSYLQGDYE